MKTDRYFESMAAVSAHLNRRAGRSPRRRPMGSCVLAALALAGFCAACNDNSRRVRARRDASAKDAGVDNGELAGRVVFAVKGEGVAASGANVILVDTASGRQVLEFLQQDTDPACSKRLAALETFLLNVAQASAQAGHPPPTATADADGYFLLPQLKPGAYLVVAYGRANEIQAIWEQPALVESYRAVMVKLVQPLLACSGNETVPPGMPPVVPPATAPVPAQPPPDNPTPP